MTDEQVVAAFKLCREYRYMKSEYERLKGIKESYPIDDDCIRAMVDLLRTLDECGMLNLDRSARLALIQSRLDPHTPIRMLNSMLTDEMECNEYSTSDTALALAHYLTRHLYND
jgi:hypothetical protein